MIHNVALGIININIDPVAIHIGSGIRWYGIMYALAFAVAYRYGVLPIATAHNVARQQVERIATACIITGLIGARLYFVVQQPDLLDYLRHPLRIIAVWEGGMAFFGAIIGAIATLGYFAWRNRKLSFWMLLDAGVFFAVVGQPIGRIGNIINGDILGARSDAFFATAYTFPAGLGHCAVLQPGFLCGVGYQPAAVYEMLGTLAIGAVLFWLRHLHTRDGIIGITYVALYAVSQFLIFFLRDSEPVIGLGLKQAQWTSLAILLVIVPTAVLAWRRWGRGDGAMSSGKAPDTAVT